MHIQKSNDEIFYCPKCKCYDDIKVERTPINNIYKVICNSCKKVSSVKFQD